MIWLGETPTKPWMQISLIKGGKVGYTPIKLTCQWKIIIFNRRSINMNNELKMINDSYNETNSSDLKIGHPRRKLAF